MIYRRRVAGGGGEKMVVRLDREKDEGGKGFRWKNKEDSESGETDRRRGMMRTRV